MEQQREVLTGAQFVLYRNLGFRTRSDSVRTRADSSLTEAKIRLPYKSPQIN